MTTFAPNAMLVRYNKGHLYVGSSQGAREAFVKLDTDDENIARDFAERYLDLYATDSQAIALQGPVLNASQIPGGDYALGDSMGGNKIVGLPMEMTGEADTVVTPELIDPVTAAREALDRRAERLGRGVQSEYATPEIQRQDQGTGTDTSPPPFSLGQELYPTTFPWWVCTRPYWCTWVEATLDQAGETTSRIDLQHNGNLVKSIMMGPGEKRKIMRVAKGWLPEPVSVMSCEIKVAGRRAAKLAVTPKGTMI